MCRKVSGVVTTSTTILEVLKKCVCFTSVVKGGCVDGVKVVTTCTAIIDAFTLPVNYCSQSDVFGALNKQAHGWE